MKDGQQGQQQGGGTNLPGQQQQEQQRDGGQLNQTTDLDTGKQDKIKEDGDKEHQSG